MASSDFQADQSLIQICLARMVRADEPKLRRLLNRYVLICDWLTRSNAESGGRWHNCHEGRKVVKVRLAAIAVLRVYAETGTLVTVEHRERMSA